MNMSHEDLQALLPGLLRPQEGQGEQEGAQRENHVDEALSSHLAQCSSCQQELALLKELAALDIPQPDGRFWSSLSTEAAKALKSKAPAPDKAVRTRAPSLTTQRSWRFYSLRAMAPALAACFILALATWHFLPQGFLVHVAYSPQVYEALWTEESSDELYALLDTGIGIEPGLLSRDEWESLFEALNDRNESGG